MKWSKYYKISSLITAIFLLATFASQAQISANDTWSKSGELSLSGAGWSAIFSRDDGALLIYSKSRNKEVIRIIPLHSTGIISCDIESDNQKQIEVMTKLSSDNGQIMCSFIFDKKGSIEIRPFQSMEGVRIYGKISYGIVPAAPLEDIIYDPAKYTDSSQLYLPSENIFMGLLEGENRLFFCAWPDGDQKARLLLGDDEYDSRTIEAVEIRLDNKAIFLQTVNAPGIWRREPIQREYLGKDIRINWQRPFSATWKTQLNEGDIETNFNFKTWQQRTWRPNFGFYDYPVWFDEQITHLHMSKKVSSSGQALIYALEGHKNTPMDFARKNIGEMLTLAPATRLRRYPVDNVGIQNCDGRAWTKWIFKMNLQNREGEFLNEVMDDFIYSIRVDARRLGEYEDFIPKMKTQIDSWLQEEENADAKSFLAKMSEKIYQIEKEYWNKMHESPASQHLKEEIGVVNELRALVDESGIEIYPEVVHLLDRIQLWSDIEAVPGRVGGLLREMFQQAGYGCATDESLVKYSEKIRRDIREFIISAETHETIY